MANERELLERGDALRYDVIDLFERAAHCTRWEERTEIAAAFIGALDRYIDWRIDHAAALRSKGGEG